MAWVATLTLLRATGHALRYRDAGRSVHLRTAIEEAYRAWRTERNAHAIFFDFIVRERNCLLKEARSGLCVVGDREAPYPAGPKVVVEFDGGLMTAEQLIKSALGWWEVRLFEIESRAEQLREIRKSKRRHSKNRGFSKYRKDDLERASGH